MNLKKVILLVGILATGMLSSVLAQDEEESAAQAAPAFPQTDIFVARLGKVDGVWRIGEPVNMTNRAAYDNQPFFTSDGKGFYYTSEREGQTDLFVFNLETGQSSRVTESAESEFSPTVMPDGSGLSTVVIEADGTQRLWRTNFDGQESGPLVHDVTGVGYHAWIGDKHIAMFIVADPIALHVIDMETKVVKVMDDNIGRALTVYPGQTNALVYTGPGADEQTWVKTVDVETGVIQTLIPVPGEAQDMVWLPDGSLLMSDRGKIMRWGGGEQDRWEIVADFSASLGESLTRLAVNPAGDRIALVANHPAE